MKELELKNNRILNSMCIGSGEQVSHMLNSRQAGREGVILQRTSILETKSDRLNRRQARVTSRVQAQGEGQEDCRNLQSRCPPEDQVGDHLLITSWRPSWIQAEHRLNCKQAGGTSRVHWLGMPSQPWRLCWS